MIRERRRRGLGQGAKSQAGWCVNGLRPLFSSLRNYCTFFFDGRSMARSSNSRTSYAAGVQCAVRAEGSEVAGGVTRMSANARKARKLKRLPSLLRRHAVPEKVFVAAAPAPADCALH